ncbi:MAG: DUF421 domain-containing protein [Oscillospiraceae bacterium]|nr:DUF421 domain-containing protein [Oscillospiraceae bacterium]
MEFLKIIGASLGSVTALFLLTKLMGNRQMSQLSMFDYINGITIGSIAAEMATTIEGDVWQPLVAMSVYGLLAVLISVVTEKSIVLRRILTGKPLTLYSKGKLYQKNLKTAKLDVNEFLTQCRTSGYFDLSDLESAVLETNGRISFLPKSDARPVTPKDLQLSVPSDGLVANVIIDGKVMTENLKNTGNNLDWLEKQLKQHHVTVSEVLLATCDCHNQCTIYKRRPTEKNRDLLQ